MKNLLLMAFTERGLALEERLYDLLKQEGYEVEGCLKSRHTRPAPESPICSVEEKLSDWAGQRIPGQDGVIFIGAAGIAVRTMAPLVESKRTDPAVVVLDEGGQFVISLLSGHLGGANALTSRIAELTGAIPVITTATDVNQRLAIDVFAKQQGFRISDMTLAKEVSARILKGEKLYYGVGSGYSGRNLPTIGAQLIPGTGESPDGRPATFWVALPDGKILHLIPRNLVLGIGCKKDTPVEIIERQVEKYLNQYRIFPEAIGAVASIDLKKDEPGLLEFCRQRGLSLTTYTAEELREARGDFTPSAFVSGITGVDNVCERSAYLASGQGELLIRKQAESGVTVACAVKEWSVNCE